MTTAHLARAACAAASCLAALLAVRSPAGAQDFEAPAPAWPPGSATVFLERALVPPGGAPALEGAVTRWHGLAALTTRAVAVASGWRALRAGFGLSQTGEPDLGWTALAAGLGAADRRGGACLRAVARRDRTSPFGFDDHGAAVGLEIGGGAWLAAADGLHAWAAAPQIWTRGAAPPLARPLEIGAAADLGALTLWLVRAGVAGASRGARGERTAGLSTRAGPLEVWLLARDQPLRGGLGIATRVSALRAAGQIESHPVLGETTRLSVSLGGER